MTLRIGKRQQEALRAAQLGEFVERAAAHLWGFFPGQCDALGDAALRGVIRHGITRAADYGVIGEREVTLYLDLMMVLGADFDSDPGLPWARDILVDEALPEPARRMRRLFRSTLARIGGAARSRVWAGEAAGAGGLGAAGAAALAGSGEPVGGVTAPCEAHDRRIPIVFVPGVMGSRLRFPTIDQAWDPDDLWAMFHWLRISAERKRDELRSAAAAEVMTTSDDLSPDERAHGYASVAMAFYVPFLRFLRGQSFKLGVANPVYGVGYDWRQSNRDSGAYLTREVERILAAEGASQLILISHSMGGMVTRAAMQAGLAGKVLGVVHIFQPVDGAPVLYRRFFTGAQRKIDSLPMALILGNTPEKFATVSSGMPGPIELLPTNNYRDTGEAAWLQYRAGGATAAWAGDVYEGYTGAASPPALLDFAAPPQGVSAAAAAELRANVRAAGGFHAGLGRYQHPRTRTIHSGGLDTDMAIVFDPPTRPAPKLHELGPFSWQTEVAWRYRGAQRQHRAEGDGTVPAPSAEPLKPNLAVQGVEHSAACNDAAVRGHVRRWIEELLS